MDSMTPKTPDNMYHTYFFMKNIKTSKMYDVILQPFWNFANKKGCRQLPEWQIRSDRSKVTPS